MYDNNREPLIDTRSATFYIIFINAIFFIVSHYLPGLIPNGPGILALYYPSSENFLPLQIFTHMFMHANFWHIFLNMYGLFMFGSILERVWGPRRFIEFYFLTGLGAMLLHTAVQALQIYNLTGSVAPPNLLIQPYSAAYNIINNPVIGASGAVFGIITAFALLFPNTELFIMFIPIPVKAKYAIGGYVLMELYAGISNNPADNVAHFAHLGGALIGFIIVKIWNKNRNFLF